MMKMEYIKAEKVNQDKVFEIVQRTIKTIYPNYYPQEVVDFFCELHSKDHIAEDIRNGCAGIFLQNDEIIGTGSRAGNHITRVYVLPEYQGRGIGTYIMQCLENEISVEYAIAVLDASLPARQFYAHRGYHTVKHEKYPVANDVVLAYEVMEKVLNP